jgi:hypothetical protein
MLIENVQDLTLETRSLEILEKVLAATAAATRCTHLWLPGTAELASQYPSHAAAYLTRHVGREPFELGWLPPDKRQYNYLPICRLTPDRSPDPLEVEVELRSPGDLVTRAMELVRAVDHAPFDATGEGPFRGCEGTVVTGYRLHGGALSSGLRLMLCHFYLSK